MRVGIDYRPCLRPNSARRGVGIFVRHLVHHLLSLDGDNRYRVYCSSSGKVDLPTPDAQWRRLPTIRRPSRLNWMLDRWTLPAALRRDRIELFHATDQTSLPLSAGCRVWAYVHDVIPLLFWRQMRPTMPADFRAALRLSYRRAARCDRIVTVSECSKRDICRMLEVDPDRVLVIHQGCAEVMKPRDPSRARERLEERLTLAGPFALYVGGSDFRKNLPFLLRAFSKIRKRGYGGKLVLAGETFRSRIPEVRTLRALAGSLGLEEALVYPGFVTDETLADLYAGCDVFVFPSLYEGFGIPLVEAMRCGAPVLASSSGALPEVGGGAVEYFDPRDVDELVDRFVALAGDASRRQELSRMGLERAPLFDWGRAARRLLQWYPR